MSTLFCPAVLFTSTLMAAVFFLVPRSIADPDIWWHLRNAEILVSSHRFIGTDLYSYTAFGAPWINHEWLSELPFYFGWQLGEEGGIYFIMVLAIELLMLGIFLLAYRRSKNVPVALAASIIAAVLSTVSFGPRTVLFGWIFLVAELLVSRLFRKPTKSRLDPPGSFHGLGKHAWLLDDRVRLIVRISGLGDS